MNQPGLAILVAAGLLSIDRNRPVLFSAFDEGKLLIDRLRRAPLIQPLGILIAARHLAADKIRQLLRVRKRLRRRLGNNLFLRLLVRRIRLRKRGARNQRGYTADLNSSPHCFFFTGGATGSSFVFDSGTGSGVSNVSVVVVSNLRYSAYSAEFQTRYFPSRECISHFSGRMNS